MQSEDFEGAMRIKKDMARIREQAMMVTGSAAGGDDTTLDLSNQHLHISYSSHQKDRLKNHEVSAFGRDSDE